MKTNKYKILVLSDLKDKTESILKNTISLAKMIDGDITLFHVKPASDIVDKESQLSAMRTINSQYNSTKSNLEGVINPISEEYNTSIKHVFAFGNVKHEIEKYVKASKPDIIVLGKKRSKPFSFIGDSITQFVFKLHEGAIMIASDENGLEPNKEISLGLFNDMQSTINVDFAEDLLGNAQRPLKSFKISKKSNAPEKTSSVRNNDTIEYVFEKTDNAIKNLSNYVSKNKINLLCVNREGNNAKQNIKTLRSDIKEVINNLNVSLLVSGQRKYTLQ